MKALTAAAIAVMKEVKGMEKNSRVGSGGMAYNGTKDQDVSKSKAFLRRLRLNTTYTIQAGK